MTKTSVGAGKILEVTKSFFVAGVSKFGYGFLNFMKGTAEKPNFPTPSATTVQAYVPEGIDAHEKRDPGIQCSRIVVR